MAHWHDVLEEVVRVRGPALVGYATLFVPDRGGAEDLVQEALVRVFGRARAVTDVHAAEGYVRHAIRTTFLDQYRRRKGWEARTHLLVQDATVRGPEHAVTAGIDVGAALRVLSPRERACIVLRHFEDMPTAEIAADLGLSHGAVRRYLSDATAKLRAVLGDRAPRPPSDDALATLPVVLERSQA